MKKLLLSVISVGLIVYANAQTEQGRILLGASSNYSFAADQTGSSPGLLTLGYTKIKYTGEGIYDTDEPDKLFNFNIIPKMGFFLFDNLVIGGELTVGFSNLKSHAENDYTWVDRTEFESQTYMVGLGPFVRYYIPRGDVMPFFEVGGMAAMSSSKYEDFYNSTNTENSIIMFKCGAGFAFAATERAMFDFMLNYNASVHKAINKADMHKATVGSFGFNIGFVYSLGY